MNSPPTPPYCGSVAAALHLMNSPPTPPYCGSVAAALHLMNSQIRSGSCREKVYGVFYKLRDKKRSKECAYVSLNLIFRTPLISVYRLAMDATRKGGWCGRLKIRSLLGSFQPAQHQRLVRAVCIKRKGFFRFLSFIHSFNFWTIRVTKTRIFLH